MTVDFVQAFKGEYFSVAIEGEDKIPVFLTLADDWDEARLWADKQLRELAEVAQKNHVPLPFDPATVKLFDRDNFLEQIGVEAASSSAFRLWYAFSRIGYLRRRLGPLIEALSGSECADLQRIWANLDDSLDKYIRLPFSEEDHEPGVECFTCSGLATCEKGQRYTLAHGARVHKPLWN